MSTLIQACCAEGVGTFILVLFGVGAVHVAVLTGALAGLWQVASVWGVAVALAIHVSAARSGAHLNPAITLACAVHRGFPWRRVPAYLVAQLVGAILAAAVLYLLFHPAIAAFEEVRHIVRGGAGSERSAMIYGEYFPHPAIAVERGWPPGVVPLPLAMAAEGVGTALLAFVIFTLTDPGNDAAPGPHLTPAFIGLTVAIAIVLIAPFTQAGFNPARDLGPRLVAWWAGWGDIAIPGPRGGFFSVYILAPILGAVAGGAVQRLLATIPPPATETVS